MIILQSKDSLDPNHIWVHRGVQEYLKEEYLYDSPYYYKNTKILGNAGFKAVEWEETNEHRMDNEVRHLFKTPGAVLEHDDNYNFEDINDGYAQWNEDFGWKDAQ